jgi:hypothetical protein
MYRVLQELQNKEISSQDNEQENVYKNHLGNSSNLRKRRQQIFSKKKSQVSTKQQRKENTTCNIDHQNTDTEESEYHPSCSSSSSSSPEKEQVEEEEEEETSVDHLLEKTIQHLEHTFEEENIEFDEEKDLLYWKNAQEKKKWIQHYQKANALWIQQYGCRIDSGARPEATQRLRKETKQHTLLRMILFTIILVYTFQLYTQHQEQLNLKMVHTWFRMDVSNRFTSSATKKSTRQTTKANQKQVNKLLPPTSIKMPPLTTSSMTGKSVDFTSQTEVDTCSDLILQFFKSKLHDEKLKLSTLQACDLAINKTNPKSIAWVQANVLRGDMYSLLRLFEKADQDYNTATTSSLMNTMLSREIQMKIMSNRWIRLLTEKKYTQIQQECSSILASSSSSTSSSSSSFVFSKPLQQLAQNWLQVLKKQKPLKDILIQSRAWTLKRLLYY